MLSDREWFSSLIVVRGAGDLATGILYRLFQCGFPLLALEIANPSCIRRTVSFCEAVFDGEMRVEEVTSKRVDSLQEAYEVYKEGKIPIMVAPDLSVLNGQKPRVIVDAIIAKRNLGTKIEDADIVIGVGPGFTASVDCHAVVETKRGHHLGRVLYEGSAIPNTGIPGIIAGHGADRVIHAPASGSLHIIRDIGSVVEEGEVIATIGETEVYASLSGILRGMIREGYPVKKGLKIADIDPRIQELENYRSISDKARSIGGGVLEAILHLSC